MGKKTKEKKVKRLPTGIPGMDEIMEGGLEENSINLIAGSTGTGKTILAMQFLVNGIIKNNEPGIYITFEEPKAEIFRNMARFGWDLAKFEEEGKLIFLEYPPEHVRKLLAEGGGLIEEAVEKSGAKRMVIDSISSFTMLYKDELEKREESLTLFELIRKWGCTSLFTCEDELHDLDYTISSELEFEVDGVILLYNIRERGVRKRAMEILKMRGTNHLRKTINFEITDKGINVHPDQVVEF